MLDSVNAKGFAEVYQIELICYSVHSVTTAVCYKTVI